MVEKIADFNADELLTKVTGEEVLKAQSDLLYLFKMEVKARDVYFQELRRFEGREFETIKWLSDQEAKHIQIIESILSKANIIVKEQKTPAPKFDSDTKEILKYDILFEDVAVKAYSSAAKKTSGPLSVLLNGLMNEEIVHVERLNRYLKK
jgi:rubrerythrin